MSVEISPGAALAAKRWKGTTKAQRSAVGRQLANAATAAMTPDERSTRARKAAAASAKVRTKNAKAKKSLSRKSAKNKG